MKPQPQPHNGGGRNAQNKHAGAMSSGRPLQYTMTCYKLQAREYPEWIVGGTSLDNAKKTYCRHYSVHNWHMNPDEVEWVVADVTQCPQHPHIDHKCHSHN